MRRRGGHVPLAIVDYQPKSSSVAVNAVARVTTSTAATYAAAEAGDTGVVPPSAPWRDIPANARPGIRSGGHGDVFIPSEIYGDLAAVEAEWRRFEQVAECTPFQAFDWLSAWQRHVGIATGVRPAIVVGRFGKGDTAFILPLGVAPTRLARRLCWLGEHLCDYQAPLLARNFSQRVTPERFLDVWQELCARLKRDPLYRYDFIELENMPQAIGAETNPFIHLAVRLNASGAHATRLGDDWETFYRAKRSSGTRRRDRSKRKHLSEFGDIRFITAANAEDARHTLETLMQQKSRALARHGVADLFAPAGHREFFLDLAANARMRARVHISRVEVGSTIAAANLGVVFGDGYYHILTSYGAESELARYGPGALHLRELLAYAIGRGLKRFDFTIGDEPYKLEWSDTELKLYDYVAAANWRGWLPSRLTALRRRIKRWIKQTPWAWRLVSRARSVYGTLSHLRLSRRCDSPLPP